MDAVLKILSTDRFRTTVAEDTSPRHRFSDHVWSQITRR
jgi:hypothetical protein